jgi:acyl-CoA synthetase (NDP forming)
VDIWPAALMIGIDAAYGQGMEIVLNDPNVDAVVPILMLTADFGLPPLDFIVDLARRHPEKPIYATFSGDKDLMEQARSELEPRGVPTFSLIEEPFEVLSILARCRQAMARP